MTWNALQHRHLRRCPRASPHLTMGAAAVIVNSSEGMRMAYDGGKAQAGMFQWIINRIPPHRVYVELCLGDGAILRAKRPAEQTIGVEIDPAVIAQRWRGDEVPNLSLRCQSAIEFIAAYSWQGDEFVYCDPPYLMQTRSSKRPIYRYEMMQVEQHRELLGALRRLPCMVAASSYWSAEYELGLAGWRFETIQTTKRSGEAATEYLWMNYPQPLELHDYKYLGRGFRERERIKRRRERWKQRLLHMPALERMALLAAIDEVREESRCAGIGDGSARNDGAAGELASIASSDDESGASRQPECPR